MRCSDKGLKSVNTILIVQIRNASLARPNKPGTSWHPYKISATSYRFCWIDIILLTFCAV